MLNTSMQENQTNFNLQIPREKTPSQEPIESSIDYFVKLRTEQVQSDLAIELQQFRKSKQLQSEKITNS